MKYSEHQAFSLCKTLMILTGLWRRNMPKLDKKFQIIYNIFSFLNQGLYVIAKIYSVFYMYELIKHADDFSSIANLLSRIIFVVLVLFRIFICQSMQVMDLLLVLKKEERKHNTSTIQKIRNIYRRNYSYSKWITCVIFFTTFLATVTFVFNGIMLFVKIYIIYTKKDRINANKENTWVQLLIIQIISPIQTFTFSVVSQVLMHSLMIFLKTEFKILQYQIEHFENQELEVNQKKPDNKTDYNYEVLKNLVIKHQTVIRFAKQFNHSIKNLLLLEYGVTSLMLATTLMQIYSRKMMTYNILFLTLCVLQIFMLCWNANEILVESSEGMSNAIYRCKWYEQNKESRRLIYLMMLRCKVPVALTIGPFGALTVDGAVSRVKLAYSFLSVISTQNE
ncbi:uncharacterized protein LOC126735627 [Anthonomus grandis grandis]|uniref:uncharacterized protein LOC126735627 n=1 Tax=Anthonomus grandis grandis TaxID=2921223 RepID=UPI002166857D|nr:uncharacterized protein LOC126735627 [Anthonomus grandis grandis]